MKLLHAIITATIFISGTCANALGANDCTNPTYRQNNPEKCNFFGGATALVGGSTIAASALALASLASTGGGGGHSGGVQPTLTTRYYVGNDLDSAHLAGIMGSETFERNFDQYNSIRLAWSLGRGWTGVGTNIAVLDSGPDTWHGRTVASFASGAVAPDAHVTEYKIVDEKMDFLAYADIARTIASAPDANVYNASWSVGMRATELKSRAQLERLTDPAFVTELSNATTTRDAIFVWAAGNDAANQSSMLSAMPRVVPELRGHFINVVAFDNATGALADYSNACGITRDWCITAPGSLITDDGAHADGTSFAAPIVSAAIATVRQAFPYMTASQVTSLLFETARDLGAPGIDAIYGHGMLDLERATRPVGVALIPLDDGTMQPLRTARVSGQIAHSIKSANPKFAFFDAYGRAFPGNLNDNISIKNPSVGWRHLHGNQTTNAMDAGNIQIGLRSADFLPTSGFLNTDRQNFISFIGATNTWEYMGAEIFQNATIGHARPETTNDSFITGFSDITTASFAVGTRIQDWTFSVSIPDTVVSGNMTMRLPTGRAPDGTILYHDYTADLVTRPSVDISAKYKFMTVGFVDNPYGTDELYLLGTWRLQF